MNRRNTIVLVVSCSIVLSVVSLTEAQAPAHEDGSLTVMTWNLYLGAPLESLFAVDSPLALAFEGATLWATVQQTNFDERAEAITDQIALKQPDLIGLQEAVLWRIQSPGDFAGGNLVPNAETVVYDFLQILLDKLEIRGLHYDVLAVVEASDIEGLAFRPGSFTATDDIRMTDRDVILARADVQEGRHEYSNVQAKNFHAKVTQAVMGVPIDILSSWASVDVNTPDGTLRFVTTHLSALSDVVRLVQIGELLAGPLDTDLPVIFVGDLNSSASAEALVNDAPTYDFLISYGFVDAWKQAGSGPGLTAWQDGDLLSPESILDRRIDFVLYRGNVTVLNSDVVGEEQEDRTSSGLWPSDHAGVSAEFVLHSGGGQ